ncbi:MAG TPA: hypothetical protein VKT51_09205 [Candidatus Eremiobacteraceae bacterium]|nr:hypothetical protein [Candidatus Eremiobacteraceae bacterium]
MFVALAAAVSLAAGASSPGVPQATASPIVPTESERALFEQGRSVERIMLALAHPQIFSIALLRDRSLADLTASETLLATGPDAKNFSHLAAELETLRPFIDRGDNGVVNGDLGGGAFFEPYMTKSPPNPEQWWIVEAGMASVDTDAARADFMATMFQSIHPSWLAGHMSWSGRFASIMPPGSAAVGSASQPQPLSQILASPSPGASKAPSLSETELESYQAAVSKALADVFPEPAFPAVAYGTGDIADGRRGIALVTAAQMLDSPSLLGQRESQSFIDEFFDSFASSTTDAASRTALASARAQFAIPVHAEDYGSDSRIKAFYSGLKGVTMNGARLNRERLGEYAALAFENATSLRNLSDDSTIRTQIGSLSNLDAAVPGLANARLALASAKSGDWLDIRAKSLIVVNLIMGSN